MNGEWKGVPWEEYAKKKGYRAYAAKVDGDCVAIKWADDYGGGTLLAYPWDGALRVECLGARPRDMLRIIADAVASGLI